MIEMLANDAGELVLVIYGGIVAAVCFVAFWKIKSIWLFSFGMTCVALALVFWHIYITERTPGLIVLNRLLWILILTVIVLFAIDLLRVKKRNAGKQ